MKVKFANTSVDIWKLRLGTVVSYENKFYHISELGCVDNIDGEVLVGVCINNNGGLWANSDELEWIDPH